MAHRVRVLLLTVLTAQAGLPAGAQPERAFEGAPSPEACAALGFQVRPTDDTYAYRRQFSGPARPAYAPPPPPPPVPSIEHRLVKPAPSPAIAQAPSVPPLPVPPVERRIEEPRARGDAAKSKSEVQEVV